MATHPHVPNEQLAKGDVPSAEAPLAELVAFAHSFHAYKVAGSVSRVTGIAKDAHDSWATDGSLPDDLTTLRTVLFALARAHDGTGMGQSTIDFIRALVGRVSEVAPVTAASPRLPSFEEASADLERENANDLLDELRGELGLEVAPSPSGEAGPEGAGITGDDLGEDADAEPAPSDADGAPQPDPGRPVPASDHDGPPTTDHAAGGTQGEGEH